MLQQRIFNSPSTTPFVFNVTPAARAFLLREGTDMKYGARHLKRAIERSLVHPLSNLIASGSGARRRSSRRSISTPDGTDLTFVKEAEDMPAYAMVQMIEVRALQLAAAAAAACARHRTRTAKSLSHA